MTTLRGLFKVVIFVIAVVIYLLISFVGQIFIRDPKKRHHFFTDLVHYVCLFGTRLLNIKVIAKNVPSKGTNYLLVGNHLGILDIIVLSAIRPALFITSVEMKETPGLGLLCEMAGCLFVERRSRHGIHKEIEQIRTALQQGVNVVLYPEGTSTNGEKVLPFKKSLLTAAAGTNVHILPMVVNYTMCNGEPMSAKWRDYVCWYGDQSFPPVFWRLMTMKSCVAELEFLKEIKVHSEEDRREIAAHAHDQIASKFKPISN